MISEKAVVPDHAREHRTQRQDTQWDQHDHRAFMRMFMCMFVTTRRAIKGQENQTPAIERCKQRRDDQHPEGIATCGAGPCAFDDRVFGQETRETDMCQRNTNTRNRQGTDHHRPIRIWDFLAQTAIVAHVLFMVHRVDHRPRAKEQHCLEKRVCEQMEHRHRIDTNTCGHEHVSQLRTGGICDNAFDVVLHQTNSRGKKCRGRAQECDECHRLWRVFHQGRHTTDKEHARGHHGRRVDQGRHRCRAFHRVGQPCVQNQLGRFTHGTDEQQERQQVRRIPFGPQEMQLRFRQGGCRRKDIVKHNAIGQIKQAENTQGKAKVTHTVDNEGLDRRCVRRGFFVIEPDQQVGCDAHAFPAKEHLDKVVGRDQHQHRKGKERQIGKEPCAVRFVMRPVIVMRHIAKAVQMYQCGHSRHNDQHDRGQTVQTYRPICR